MMEKTNLLWTKSEVKTALGMMLDDLGPKF